VSYISLSSGQGRSSLAGLFGQAKALVQAGIICEVCDIENVPQAALLAATSLLKPFCLLLIGRSAASSQTIGQMRNAGLQALSFDVPQDLASERAFQDWAIKIITAAKRAAKSVMIYQLTPRQAGMAALLGASHASLR
jgi:hypothetical protein